jgi:hypothetical protein
MAQGVRTLLQMWQQYTLKCANVLGDVDAKQFQNCFRRFSVSVFNLGIVKETVTSRQLI